MAADDGIEAVLPFIPGGSMLSLVNEGLLAAQGKALFVEKQSMIEYRKRVDALLDQLKGSNAEHGKFAHGTLAEGKLGTGFAEAGDLQTAYNKVRSQMEDLSKALGNQIESLGIAIEASRIGYENMDEDIKARMRSLQKQARDQYKVELDPGAQGHHTPEPNAPSASSPQPNTDTSTSGGDM
ncbi:hypothetical protein [Streptomyces sp. NPDC089799]|uniref:hypothetical protein n=1 Tax=Streptomyces sp. NPDC089799 TaxID=3155066 RepID=UPI00341A9BF1